MFQTKTNYLGDYTAISTKSVDANLNSPLLEDLEEQPDFSELDGAGAATGINPMPPPIGGSNGGIGGGLVILEQEVDEGGTVELWCGAIVASTTPSMPWHLMDEPAVQILGLMIWTLLRKT